MLAALADKRAELRRRQLQSRTAKERSSISKLEFLTGADGHALAGIVAAHSTARRLQDAADGADLNSGGSGSGGSGSGDHQALVARTVSSPGQGVRRTLLYAQLQNQQAAALSADP